MKKVVEMPEIPDRLKGKVQILSMVNCETCPNVILISDQAPHPDFYEKLRIQGWEYTLLCTWICNQCKENSHRRNGD